MKLLITGAPGCGKTTLVEYAKSLGDNRFYDADYIDGLCEWRSFETGEVIGSVSDFDINQNNDWYEKNGWYWNEDFLHNFLDEHTEVVMCGSSENMGDCYKLFDKIIFLKKTHEELESNLTNPDRENPFGKDPEHRKGIMKWQDFIIKMAQPYDSELLEGNQIEKSYRQILEVLGE